MSGSKRFRDSAVVQFVLRREKVSVAAVKIEISWVGGWGVVVGEEEGLDECKGEDGGVDGGVGYEDVLLGEADGLFFSKVERNVSRPLIFGRSH